MFRPQCLALEFAATSEEEEEEEGVFAFVCCVFYVCHTIPSRRGGGGPTLLLLLLFLLPVTAHTYVPMTDNNSPPLFLPKRPGHASSPSPSFGSYGH